jgi:hypothetical protein
MRVWIYTRLIGKEVPANMGKVNDLETDIVGTAEGYPDITAFATAIRDHEDARKTEILRVQAFGFADGSVTYTIHTFKLDDPVVGVWRPASS